MSSPPPVRITRSTPGKLLRKGMRAEMTAPDVTTLGGRKRRFSNFDTFLFSISNIDPGQKTNVIETLTEKRNKFKKDILSRSPFPTFPNVKAGSSAVSNAAVSGSPPVDLISKCDASIPSITKMTREKKVEKKVKTKEEEEKEELLERRSYKVRCDDPPITLKPPPGFFNNVYDQAWGDVHAVAGDVAYLPTLKEEKVANRRFALEYEVRQKWGQPAGEVIASWNTNNTWPLGEGLVTLRDLLAKAEQSLMSVKNKLRRKDPNTIWRSCQRMHYPQDVSTALDQATKLGIDRAWPKDRDAHEHARLRRLQRNDISWPTRLAWCRDLTPLPTKPKKRNKRRSLPGPYPYPDKQVRRRKRGIDALDDLFDAPQVFASAGIPFAMFALKFLWWDYIPSLKECRRLGDETLRAEEQEARNRGARSARLAHSLADLGARFGETYSPAQEDLAACVQQEDWEDFERGGVAALGATGSWLRRGEDELEEVRLQMGDGEEWMFATGRDEFGWAC